MMDDDGWMWGHGWGWGGWVLMGVVMMLFVVALIVAIVVAIRYLSTPAPRASRPSYARPGPESVLADRFARGEIDEDEYRRRLSLLRLHS